MGDGLRLAVTLLTVLRLRGPTEVTRRAAAVAMATAAAVGLALGALAAQADRLPGLLGPVAAVATLAIATRGLHLDGLADLADGLGAGRTREQALAVMSRGDVGPFGVVTVVLVLFAQVAALGRAHPADLAVAGAASRAVLALACARGVPAARPEGLGALVAGTVPRTVAGLVTLVVIGVSSLVDAGQGAIAAAVGIALALALLTRAVSRLGGVTGDVLGALVETAMTGTLVAAALLR
ncbi:MAG: adenosylcobinamide-GDP ribazoletransferase [Mycobacteriales bacterium]